MLVEVVADRASFVISVPDSVGGVLPFRTEVVRWKDELYFRTPYEVRPGDLTGCVRVEAGRVYYWPPGRAFCIFYGISEPYTEVYPLGDYVGPLGSLRGFSEGSAEVVRHELSSSLAPVADALTRLGYSVATPLEDGVRVVVASRYLGGVRVAFKALVEEYGLYIESDSFFRFSDDFTGLKAAYSLKRRVHRLSSLVRLDLNEGGYVCLTAVARNPDELRAVLTELEDSYQYVFKELAV